jgi:hypothetical protein
MYPWGHDASPSAACSILYGRTIWPSIKLKVGRVGDEMKVKAMRSAYYKVCDALLLKGDVDDPMTEVIVNKIFALVKGGEHDAERLAEHVLNDLVDGPPPPSNQTRQDDPSPQV